MNPLGYAPLRRIRLEGMILLVVVFAGSLTVVSAAAASSISAQTTSGNVGISSGKACDPGDADCLGDETDDSNFYTFTYICYILRLFMMLEASWVAAVWVAGTVAAAVGWARERGLMVPQDGLFFNWWGSGHNFQDDISRARRDSTRATSDPHIEADDTGSNDSFDRNKARHAYLFQVVLDPAVI